VAVWYFATTGAILTYFFSHIGGPDARPLLFVLLFLSFASLGFGYLHFRGSRHMHEILGWNTSPCLCAYPADRMSSSLQPFC
jgi:thiosulfate reductase cytochrome b subunit